MNVDAWAHVSEAAARFLGWFGGALYLVDLVGGRLRSWRIEAEIYRRFPGSGGPIPSTPFITRSELADPAAPQGPPVRIVRPRD